MPRVLSAGNWRPYVLPNYTSIAFGSVIYLGFAAGRTGNWRLSYGNTVYDQGYAYFNFVNQSWVTVSGTNNFTNTDQLAVFDVRNPAAPVRVGWSSGFSYSSGTYGPQFSPSLFKLGNRLLSLWIPSATDYPPQDYYYITSWDISTPGSPVYLGCTQVAMDHWQYQSSPGQYYNSGTAYGAVAQIGGTNYYVEIYITRPSTGQVQYIRLWNASTASFSMVSSASCDSVASKALCINNSMLYFPSYSYNIGIEAWNLSNPASPSLAGYYSFGGDPNSGYFNSITNVGSVIYASYNPFGVNGADRIARIDFSNPASPVATFDFAASDSYIWPKADNLVYVALSSVGLMLAKVTSSSFTPNATQAAASGTGVNPYVGLSGSWSIDPFALATPQVYAGGGWSNIDLVNNGKDVVLAVYQIS